MKNKKKPKIRKDRKGEYILRHYFVGGKQKSFKVYVIGGIPVDEYWEKYADPVALMQNGDYDLLEVRMQEEAEARIPDDLFDPEEPG